MKPFWPKNQEKNLNILRTKWAFEMKERAFFTISKGRSVTKNCLRLKSVPLTLIWVGSGGGGVIYLLPTGFPLITQKR